MGKPRGKTVQLHNMYVADFETCDTDELFDIDKKTGEKIYYQRVWLAGYKNLKTMESKYFTTLDDFMKDILGRKKGNSNREYGFHNLKFDGSFIVPWLLKNGYKVSHDKPGEKEFSVLVDNRNNWYSITIQVTKKRKVTIWDTQKLFPTALEYLPDIYGTPTKKVKEDESFYTKKRPLGYEPDERDLHYFENDLQVPAEVLNRHIELFGLRFKKTQASQSFYNFEQTFKNWRWRFRPLSTEVDNAIRKAYWGGISYVPPDKVQKDFYNILVYDINSSYPHKAAECKLPYGHTLSEYGEDKHPDMSKFWVAEALVEFKLKPHCIPCIPAKAITEGRPIDADKWVDNSHGIVRMVFSNIDYETIQMSYDFTVVRWMWSIHWAWKRHKEIANFVHKNNNIKVKYGKLAKETTDPEKKIEYMTMRNRAKIDNNSFYGKFGEEVVKIGKTPYLENVDGKEVVRWKADRVDEQSEYNRKFLPVAIAITAWGRRQLVHLANKLGEHFLYCDTDSVHFLKTGEYIIKESAEKGEIEVDDLKLGAWSFEGEYKRGRYLRSKCYMEETTDGEIEATVAGLPADPHTGQFSKKRSCLNWENFWIGTVIPPEKSNKLRTVRTPSGNKLIPTSFQIKEKESLFAI